LKSTVLPQAEAKRSTENVSFPWPPIEAALSAFVVKAFFLDKELIKKTKLPSMPDHKLYKNVYLEKISAVAQ
jgi:hypothetical protein